MSLWMISPNVAGSAPGRVSALLSWGIPATDHSSRLARFSRADHLTNYFRPSRFRCPISPGASVVNGRGAICTCACKHSSFSQESRTFVIPVTSNVQKLSRKERGLESFGAFSQHARIPSEQLLVRKRLFETAVLMTGIAAVSLKSFGAWERRVCEVGQMS
jgi:hypothetical protein